jgi:hypothetical protein
MEDGSNGANSERSELRSLSAASCWKLKHHHGHRSLDRLTVSIQEQATSVTQFGGPNRSPVKKPRARRHRDPRRSGPRERLYPRDALQAMIWLRGAGSGLLGGEGDRHG